MPWHLIERGGRVCVVKNGETEPIPGGCHASRAQAAKHMAALYANEPQAARAAGARIIRPAHGCGCGTSLEQACTCGPNALPNEHGATAHAAAAVQPFEAPFPVPEYPTAEMFERPAWLERGQGLTIMDDGTWAGYFHDGEGCILGAPGCVQPTPSPTNYAGFHQQPQVLADGSQIRVGVIGLVGGHANPYATAAAASRHYADPSSQRLLGLAYDDFDEHGRYVGAYSAGVLVPRIGREQRPVTFGDVAEMRRCALSGDWRPMEDEWWQRNGVSHQAAAAVNFYDCIGPTFVNRPGLPLVRAYRRSQQLGRAASAAMLGGLGGVHLAEPAVLEIPDEGVNMQSITLSDGTVLEVPDGSTIVSGEGTLSVTLPTEPAVVAAAADDAGTGDAGDGAEQQAETVALTPELVEQIGRVASVVDERVIPFIDGCEAVQAAEIEARRSALDAEPVSLPA